MQNRKWYEWLLTLAYIAMVLLCVYLNVFSKSQQEGLANIVVNVVMFVIVGIIFLSCELNNFFPMNRIIADLKGATAKIRSDAMNSHQFLWEPYNASNVELFTEQRLKDEFQDYIFELNRITNTEKAYYKCDIEDYINYDLVDSVMHRNVLNQVPGVMTGLGILGTFIGLSLGLQHFSTGTTAEVTNSIGPLMDGIKVAFHTSIYGLVFSLMFNYAYKRKLDEAENAVKEFIVAYKKYVLPDTTTDGINKLMELQQQQVTAIRRMTDRVSSDLQTMLDPQFERLNGTITDFGNMATRTQMDAMAMVVKEFIRQMNQSLAGSFQQLQEIVNQSYAAQQQNAQMMQNILKETGSNAVNLQEINRQTGAVAGNLNAYAQSVAGMQQEMEKNLSNLYAETEKQKGIIIQEQNYLSDLAAYRISLNESGNRLSADLKEQESLLGEIRSLVIKLNKQVSGSNADLQQALDHQTEVLEELKNAIAALSQPRSRREIR